MAKQAKKKKSTTAKVKEQHGQVVNVAFQIQMSERVAQNEATPLVRTRTMSNTSPYIADGLLLCVVCAVGAQSGRRRTWTFIRFVRGFLYLLCPFLSACRCRGVPITPPVLEGHARWDNQMNPSFRKGNIDRINQARNTNNSEKNVISLHIRGDKRHTARERQRECVCLLSIGHFRHSACPSAQTEKCFPPNASRRSACVP